MTIQLDHVAVVVEDLSVAMDFYDQVFALPKIDRLTKKVSHNRGAWYQLGPVELHLLEKPGSGDKTQQHFALNTTAFNEIVKKVPLHGGKVEEAKLIEGVSQRCFVYDPDGNRIELLERR